MRRPRPRNKVAGAEKMGRPENESREVHQAKVAELGRAYADALLAAVEAAAEIAIRDAMDAGLHTAQIDDEWILGLSGAMSVIFFHRSVNRRHFLLSAVIPYLFILALGMGLLLVSLITGALQLVGQDTVRLLGQTWGLAGVSRALLWFLGVAGLALLLTALYMVMPVGRLSFRHALAGGVTATVLWEIVRRILRWYFSTISMVNVVYGSLASAIGVLLTLEAAALVLLLGAQVIAELERSRKPR